LHRDALNVFEEQVRNNMPITAGYVDSFTQFTMRRLERSLIEPGTAVGAIAAQSMGEPATQMTLRARRR